MNLNIRQDQILKIIDEYNDVSISFIIEKIKESFSNITRITISRDLKILLELKYIVKKGKGRSVSYDISSGYNLIKPINIEKYFNVEVDKREVKEKFNFDIYDSLNDIFAEDEIIKLDKLNKKYRDNLEKISKDILKKEYERLTIELSWKSSKIEGNTYSLLETEQLIKENIEAKNHTKDEKAMILNHKSALDYIIKNKSEFKTISVAKIENVHSLLVKGLDISRNIRKSLVKITGTKYTPLDNEYQIKEALTKICKVVNKEKNQITKAVVLMLFIAYIQPFVDGNKRTSRLMGNAVLLANNYCPLSYRSIDDIEYKKAVLIFYEQNNISYFKKLFVEQFEFAVNNYFEV